MAIAMYLVWLCSSILDIDVVIRYIDRILGWGSISMHKSMLVSSFQGKCLVQLFYVSVRSEIGETFPGFAVLRLMFVVWALV